MTRISGYFSMHGIFSFNTIPPTINEIRATFSEKGKNILIDEHFPEGPIEYTQKIKKFQELSQEIFIKSATEKNLFKLRLECEAKNQTERAIFAKLSESQTQKYAEALNTHYAIRMWEITKLRKKIDFQLLYESGTTPEIDNLNKQRYIAMEKLKFSWAIDFEKQVDASLEELDMTTKTGDIREELIRQKIDALMAQYSELNVQVTFGTGHKNMLEPYRGRQDISLRILVSEEPISSFITNLCCAIAERKSITEEEKLGLYFWRNLIYFTSIIRKAYGVSTHPGDFFDTMPLSLSIPQLKSFFCLDRQEMLIRMAKLLKEIGALETLKKRNPLARNFMFDLSNSSAKLGPKKEEPQKTGRNAPCTCGSGKKYKKCCGK